MDCRERMLAACRGKTVDRPPVWLMRQAGRYLPEYRELRARHGFWDLVRTPCLAVEASLQPVRRFGMDAGILFSDILVVLDAMGVQVRYEEGGPTLCPQVRTAADLAELRAVVPESAFHYIAEAMTMLCAELHPQHAVVGFAGAPFTLAAYLVEGGPSRDVPSLKALAYRTPELYDAIAGSIADAVLGLLRAQVRAGADVVQIFDTWAGHLTPDDYEALALPYTHRVIEGLADLDVPVILYVRNAAGSLEHAAASGCQVLSIDGSIRLSDARARLDPRIALQGNFDPALLFAPAGRIISAVRGGIQSAGPLGYIVNLGQGLLPDTPLEGVETFVNAVRERSA
jgi:uroporphyrinogen decarboxylase